MIYIFSWHPKLGCYILVPKLGFREKKIDYGK